MRGLRVATSFLTRIPVGGSVAEGDLGRAVAWFPVVGAGVGLASGAMYAGASALLPAPVAAVLALALAVGITGAFHEDGLADTADAIGIPRDREEALRILKDPRLGTFGVCSLVLGLLVRAAGIAALAPGVALAVLPAAHALGRAGAVTLLARAPAGDGLGAAYGAAAGVPRIVLAVAAGAAVSVATLGATSVPAALAVAVACAVLASVARRRLGGVTGDVLGAAQQLGEMAVLLVGVAAADVGWLPVPWLSVLLR